MDRRKLVLIGSAVVAAVGVLVWTLTGGSGGGQSRGVVSGAGRPATTTPAGGGPTTAAPGGGAATAGPTGASPTSGPRAGRTPGGPQFDAQTGFLSELGAIEPALVGDRGRMLAAGQATCQDVKAGTRQETLISNTMARFKTDGVAITEIKASLIVDAAHNHLCPG